MLAYQRGYRGDKMEEIQFFNYLFSIGALLLSAISIWIAIQADKMKEEWKKEAKYLNEKIDGIKITNNSRKL